MALGVAKFPSPSAATAVCLAPCGAQGALVALAPKMGPSGSEGAQSLPFFGHLFQFHKLFFAELELTSHQLCFQRSVCVAQRVEAVFNIDHC